MITRIDRLRTMLEQVDPGFKSIGITESLESCSAKSGGPKLESRRADPAAIEAEMALESLEALRRGNDVDSEHQFVLEAIVMPYHRPVVDVVDDYIRKDQLTAKWQKLGDEAMRSWISERVRSIGRINVPSLPSLPYAGTGFIVGDGLIMTNRHVASIFAHGSGTRTVQFQSGQEAAVDFYHENGKTTSESLHVERVIMLHPWWDMALLKVRGLPTHRKPLMLSTADPATLKGREVIVVGYPGYDPREDEEFQRIQNRIFRGTYYVKRLQPGVLRERTHTESYNQVVEAITHDSSTLGGNSGSAVIDVKTGLVVGLHFAGAYLVGNYAVSPYDLAQDGRVVDAGVNFEGELTPRGDFYGPLWRNVDANASLPEIGGAELQSPAPSGPPSSSSTAALRLTDVDQSANWIIPLRLSVSVGTPTRLSSDFPVPVARSGAPAEGIFTRQSPAAFAESASRFSATSLAAEKFDWKTALSLVLASRLSYESPTAVRDMVLNNWGLTACEFIETDGTQCFIASSPDVVVVSFRGTDSLADWLGNLNAVSTTRSYGTVHRGFLGAFQVVDSRLRSVLGVLSGRLVLLTGHSLGGALAAIAAAEWQGEFPISWIYTFGQPAVGKGGFPSFIHRRFGGRFFRFVNDDDIVPRVPPTYDHVGSLLHFDTAGRLKNGAEFVGTDTAIGRGLETLEGFEGPPMLTEAEFDRLRAHLLGQHARAQAAGTVSLEALKLEGFFPSVSDHSLEQYIAKIAAKAS